MTKSAQNYVVIKGNVPQTYWSIEGDWTEDVLMANVFPTWRKARNVAMKVNGWTSCARFHLIKKG